MPSLANKKIAVTGAGGFLGRAVVRVLVAEGASVTALLRSGHDADAMRALGAIPVQAPLVAGPALQAAMRDHDVLVHLAYDVRADAAANLAAFDAVYGAAQGAGVGHFVHASSVVVYDDWPSDTVLTEESSIGRVPAHGYRAAKIEMARRLMEGPLPATVLEPTIIWGPGSEIWTEGPMHQLRHGGMVLPKPCGRAPLLFVDDAARAFALAAALEEPGHDRFLVTGPETPSWEALFQGYAAIVGGTLLREPLQTLRDALPPASNGPSKPGMAARVSQALRAILGRKRFKSLMSAASRLRPPGGPARPDRFRLTLFATSPVIDIARAKSRLRFAPRIGLAPGLDQIRKQSSQ